MKGIREVKAKSKEGVMLKINKTLSKVKIPYYVGMVTLICGIMPGLMGLCYYGSVEKVSAATLSIDNISTMQEMRPGICYNMEIGDSATLTDTRNDSTYTVAKLSDGKCWMTQNLRIVDKEITPEDSDVTENFTIPASALWSDTSRIGSHAYYGGDVDYGAYYNWHTATAGTGLISSGNAISSICPKGWRLPIGENGMEFQVLYDKGKSSWTTNDSKNGYWIGAAGSKGGAFFPAAGYVYAIGGALRYTGSEGHYWSSTARNSYGAYSLNFDSSGISWGGYMDNYYGLSVRCVTDSYAEVLPEIPEIGSVYSDVDVVAIVVAPVISIDATSGMKEEVDPNKVTTGTISATVSANTTYSVQLSANKTSLTNSALGVDTEITNSNSIPASTNVQAKTNAWGILNQDNTTYSAITTNPTTYYNTEEYDEESQATKHTFGVGVSISPTLPAGEYSTTVTITAVNN